jgi:hypothetical protein
MGLPARHTLYRTAALLCVAGVIAVLASFPPHAFSATPTATLQGYAWSSNIGWICFYDTTNPSNCGGATVNVNSDDSLSGYAWSANAGWISFNSSDTASCGSPATYNPSTGALSGWAKALDGVDSDGCISLSCSNTGGCTTANYAVVFPGNSTTDFAWGSDVFGWISFWGSNYGVTYIPLDACTDIPGITTPPIPSGCNTPNPSPGACIPSGDTYTGSACVPITPSIATGSFTTNPTRVQANTPTSVTFQYQVTNPPAGGCTITGTGGFSTISLSQAQVTSGSYTTSETISQDTALTLTCGSATAQATLGLIPSYEEI